MQQGLGTEIRIGLWGAFNERKVMAIRDQSEYLCTLDIACSVFCEGHLLFDFTDTCVPPLFSRV